MYRREVLIQRALAVLLTVLPFGIFALTYWLGGWATYGEAPLPLLVFVVGSLLSLLLGASLALFLFFLTAMAQGSSVGIESSWGGFGGGLGGWRISSALAFLLGALFFAGAFATVAIQVGQHNAFRKWVGVPLVVEPSEVDKPAKKGEPANPDGEAAAGAD